MLWDGSVRNSARIAKPSESGPHSSSAVKKNNLVRKTFSILRAFQHSNEWLTSQELSRRVDMPKASCHRLVQTLEGLGRLSAALMVVTGLVCCCFACLKM